jgi:hypothetical protein
VTIEHMCRYMSFLAPIRMLLPSKSRACKFFASIASKEKGRTSGEPVRPRHRPVGGGAGRTMNSMIGGYANGCLRSFTKAAQLV